MGTDFVIGDKTLVDVTLSFVTTVTTVVDVIAYQVVSDAFAIGAFEGPFDTINET